MFYDIVSSKNDNPNNDDKYMQRNIPRFLVFFV